MLGMIFNYLNTAAVWDAFCGTYEAVYDLMGEFDTWYSVSVRQEKCYQLIRACLRRY